MSVVLFGRTMDIGHEDREDCKHDDSLCHAGYTDREGESSPSAYDSRRTVYYSVIVELRFSTTH